MASKSFLFIGFILIVSLLMFLSGLIQAGEKYIYYRGAAEKVAMAGDWNDWAGAAKSGFKPDNFLMEKVDGSTFRAPVKDISKGKHQYKFIINGNWEGGDNRVMNVNDNGEVFEPQNLIESANLIDDKTISVRISGAVRDISKAKFSISGKARIQKTEVVSETKAAPDRFRSGFDIDKKELVFLFKPETYKLTLSDNDKVYIASSLNGWGPNWEMTWDASGIYKLVKPADILGEDTHMFKFVVNKDRWLSASDEAENTADDGFGGKNLVLSKSLSGAAEVRLTVTGLDIKNNFVLTLTGVSDEPEEKEIQNMAFLEKFRSDKTMGASYDSKTGKTHFRLFSPRASAATVYVYAGANDRKPETELPMKEDKDGVWEAALPGKNFGKYYFYSVDGPKGEAEEFNKSKMLSDLYAAANVHNDGKSILYDINKKDAVFPGWSKEKFKMPEFSDLVISEMHVRDFTASADSKVKEELRGKYLGIVDTAGKGTGIDHLKKLGVNAVEFLPIHEFDDNWRKKDYHWGYMTSLFFTPESSFALDPEKGSQVQEFKKVVDELHKNGIAVIMDVVYNHVGAPNHYAGYDNKYYFRMKPNMTYSNFSGCGNDFRSESPMARRLIVDSILHFVEHYKIDGFRFDLAELIDLETLAELKEKALKINPDVIFIAEPWSFRGNIKNQLKGTGWASWNDDFRNNVKDFARGRGNIGMLKKVVSGSVDLWAETPLQSINYVESHDDMTLSDEMSTRADHNGRISGETELARNRITATVLFTSLGIPMLAGGQEFLRSKKGVNNSYNAGDDINEIKWEYAKKNKALLDFYAGLIALRKSDNGMPSRYAKKPKKNYITWIDADVSGATGYILNANSEAGKKQMLVLLNSNHSDEAEFEIELPEGSWQEVSDGAKVSLKGIGKKHKGNATVKIKVPKLSSRILVN